MCIHTFVVEYLTTVSVFTFSNFPLITSDDQTLDTILYVYVCVLVCFVAHVVCCKCSLKNCSVASFYSSLSSNDQTASNISRPCSMSQCIRTFASGNLISFSGTIKPTVSQCVSLLSLKSPQPGSKTDISSYTSKSERVS